MANLLARLNTYASLNNTTSDEKKYGAGIYVDFGNESETYKEGTFRKVIESILEQALISEERIYRDIAQDVQNYMAQQNSVRRFDIMVYDPKNDDFMRNTENEESMVMGLDDHVKNYIIERDISDGEESKKVDYLDIVVRLNSPVGRE